MRLHKDGAINFAGGKKNGQRKLYEVSMFLDMGDSKFF